MISASSFTQTQKQLGLSLVELLISMALSLVLLAGVLQIFSSNKKMFELTQDLSSLQEKGQFALSLLAENIRMAGHWGGVASENIDFAKVSLSAAPKGCSSSWVFQSAASIMAYQGASSLSGVVKLPSGCINVNDYLVQSDLLVIRFADSRQLMPDSVIDNAKYRKHFFVRINPGQSAFVFKGEHSAEALLRITESERVYNAVYQTQLYFLRPCSLKLNQACQDKLPTLMRLSLSGDRFVAQTLVEGVEQLKFRFGLDTNHDHQLDQYKNASDVTNWQNVMSVQINLLIRTQEQDYSINALGREYLMSSEDGSKGYRFVVADDAKHYRRQQYSREVLLRNRL